jgi:hypothetical protein
VPGGGSSSGGSGGVVTPPTPGGGQTAGIDGAWDITAFSRLADGATGDLQINGGHFVGLIPQRVSTSSTTSCREVLRQYRFDVIVADGLASGELFADRKFEGTGCVPPRVSGKLETERAVVTGKRVVAAAPSLTDMNGTWELTAAGEDGDDIAFVVTIDGGTFTGAPNRTSKATLNGSVVGNRATATANDFAFAAQKR